MAFANIPYYGKKSHFRNGIAPFCLLLGQLLLAINITDAVLLVLLACACLALPLLQPQPHLCLAAPQSLLLQTQNTKPFGLLRPTKAKQPPAFPAEQPGSGGHQQQDLFALPVLLSPSLISRGYERQFSPDPKHLDAADFTPVNPGREGE